jgi:hypothetical protein
LGRLRWLEGEARLPGKIALAAFEFDSGTLVFTEAGFRRDSAPRQTLPDRVDRDTGRRGGFTPV